ncbi:hypothetical protein MMC25_005511 [Agyrium rufum]|nr:hypothetical protein [Agyrium rufum]
MARGLPWLKSAGQPSSRSNTIISSPVPTKRTSTALQPQTAQPAPSAPASPLPLKKRAERYERTPSTSPPPAPPDEEYIFPASALSTETETCVDVRYRYMREGEDGDDSYVMVEDEFCLTAKLFTKHLHHAEYVRLKNEAKARNSLHTAAISRPTDSVTTMREELKRKKQADAKASKNEEALSRLRGMNKRPMVDSDEDSESDVVNDDDPWVGTSLQAFMTRRGVAKTSLAGLEGVRSSTRAAAGYSKPQQHQPTEATYDLPNPNVRKVSKPSVDSEASSLYISGDSDDDLEVATRNPMTTLQRIDENILVAHKVHQPSSKINNAVPVTLKPNSRKVRSLFDTELFDAGQDHKPLSEYRIGKPMVKTKPTPSRSMHTGNQALANPKSAKLSEIPIFLM